jgi:hypothetical protein
MIVLRLILVCTRLSRKNTSRRFKMNVRVGDRVEALYHMSNRGVVQEVYYVKVTAGTGSGSFSKMRRIKFLSELDGKIHDMKAQDLRVIRE